MTSQELLDALPELLPAAAAWAAEQEQIALQTGVPLNADGIAEAKRVGVVEPEKIRVLVVPTIPSPSHPALRQAAEAVGFLGPQTWGLAVGHGIYLREDQRSNVTTASHECVHVAQYERLGGILPFLTQY